MKFVGKVIEGKLTPSIAKSIGQAIRSLDEKTVMIQVSEVKPRRSLNQNAYYWAAIIPAARLVFQDAGQVITVEECHWYLKKHVGGLEKTICDPNGEVFSIACSSRTLTKNEFADFVDKCIFFIEEHGGYVSQSV